MARTDQQEPGAVPRYFFDIHDGIEVQDTEGTELPTLAAASASAMQVAAAYAGKPLPVGENGGAIVVEVRDESGRLMVVRLVFTVEIVR